jgi:hypothetical protein
MLKTPKFASTQEQSAFIRAEFDKFAQDLAESAPAPTSRTWSFELETPDADSVNTALIRAYRGQFPELTQIIGERTDPRELIEFCQDGSVSSELRNGECECYCRECNYHECDCDNCDQQNDSPDHCGDSDCESTGDYQEIKPATYCEGTHPAHLALLDMAEIGNTEINDTCGLHIHIGSADLNARDVANVIRVYRALAHIIEAIAGRRNDNYCRDNSEREAFSAQFLQESTEKYRAVNTAPHFATYRADTIEFRQHEGTNSTAEIRAWAMFMIRIVEFAKTNRTTLWLEDAQTFAQAWRLLAV